MRRFFSCISILFCLAFASCGTVSTETNSAPTPSTSTPPNPQNSQNPQNPMTDNTAIVLGANYTDPTGTLGYIPLATPRAPVSNLQITHSDALVRSFGGLLYVVNRLGGDNIEVVDPKDFHVVIQFSVGRGTNPQDIFVASPTKAYVSLYQPEDNASPGLTVDDVIEVNPQTGAILKTFDLTPFTTDDGDRFARASPLLAAGDFLFVAFQDLPGNLALPANQPGKLAVFSLSADALVAVITLQGHDPVALTYSTLTKLLYVADADYFNLQTPYGGVEIVDPALFRTQGVVIDDADLGGALGDIEVSGGKGFATVGFGDPVLKNYATKVVSFDLNTFAHADAYQSGSYIQDIAVAPDGTVLVGDRDPKVNGVVFLDPQTDAVIGGPYTVGPAPSSITFVER